MIAVLRPKVKKKAGKRRAGTAPRIETALKNVNLLASDAAQQRRSHAGALAVIMYLLLILYFIRTCYGSQKTKN